MTENTNPKISPLLRFLTFIEIIVLFAAGAGLFLAPKFAEPLYYSHLTHAFWVQYTRPPALPRSSKLSTRAGHLHGWSRQ